MTPAREPRVVESPVDIPACGVRAGDLLVETFDPEHPVAAVRYIPRVNLPLSAAGLLGVPAEDEGGA